MFCPQCGAEMKNNTSVCPKCWKPVTVPNHLVAAILTTLFCCLPCGIVALFYARNVNSMLAIGNVAGAKEASAKAKGWIVAGVIVGLLSAVLIGLKEVLTAVVEAS